MEMRGKAFLRLHFWVHTNAATNWEEALWRLLSSRPSIITLGPDLGR